MGINGWSERSLFCMGKKWTWFFFQAPWVQASFDLVSKKNLLLFHLFLTSYKTIITSHLEFITTYVTINEFRDDTHLQNTKFTFGQSREERTRHKLPRPKVAIRVCYWYILQQLLHFFRVMLYWHFEFCTVLFRLSFWNKYGMHCNATPKKCKYSSTFLSHAKR